MHIESPYKPDAPRRAEEARAALRRAGPRTPARRPAPAPRPLSRMRQSIGRAMVESLRTAATCTTIVEADMTRVDAARAAARRDRTCPSIARATVDTLREFPALNATLEGDTLTTLRGRPPRHRGLARRAAA